VETDRAFSGRASCAPADDDQGIIPVLYGIVVVEWGAGQLAKLRRLPTRSSTGQGARRILERASPETSAWHTSGCIQEICRGRAGISQRYCISSRRRRGRGRIASPTNTISSWGLFLTPCQLVLVVARLSGPALGSARNRSRSAIASPDYSRSRRFIARALSTHFGANGRSSKSVPRERSPSRKSVDFGVMVAAGRIMLTAAQAMRGPSNEPVADIRQAIAAYRSSGTRKAGLFSASNSSFSQRRRPR